jgi:hypothetical protein
MRRASAKPPMNAQITKTITIKWSMPRPRAKESSGQARIAVAVKFHDSPTLSYFQTFP